MEGRKGVIMPKKELDQIQVSVLIPCYNENKTIAKVIEDFRAQLPFAKIYVFDNNSSDGSGKIAEQAGSIVIKEKRQGKGFVVDAMLKKVKADIYVMVDGDDTYPAEKVGDLLQPILDETADMVVGKRLTEYTDKAFRPFHVFGNRLVSWSVNQIFSSKLTDPMSGFRVFTREVALELPVVAFGFEIETEMTLQLLYRRFIIKEYPVLYRERPEGSFSKLSTFRDGILVLWKIISIAISYKPLTLFGGAGLIFVMSGFISGRFAPQYGAIALSAIFLGVIFGTVGIILHAMNFRLLELTSILSKVIYWKDNRE